MAATVRTLKARVGAARIDGESLPLQFRHTYENKGAVVRPKLQDWQEKT